MTVFFIVLVLNNVEGKLALHSLKFFTMERDRKYLLKLVLKRSLWKRYFRLGICQYLKDLTSLGYITDAEHWLVFTTLLDYRTKHRMTGWKRNPAFWFKRGNSWKRRRFLKKVLKSLD